MLHKHFEETSNRKCSYSYYWSIVKGMNISFAKLGSEDCFMCEEFKQHEHDTPSEGCDICEKYSGELYKRDFLGYFTEYIEML